MLIYFNQKFTDQLALLEIFLWILIAPQWIFWGLNGFFYWLVPPAGNSAFQDFVKSCIDLKFLMPSVKIAEILAPFFLLSPQFQLLGIILLAPICFIIFGLQLFHHPHPWLTIISLCLPSFLLLGIRLYTIMAL